MRLYGGGDSNIGTCCGVSQPLQATGSVSDDGQCASKLTNSHQQPEPLITDLQTVLPLRPLHAWRALTPGRWQKQPQSPSTCEQCLTKQRQAEQTHVVGWLARLSVNKDSPWRWVASCTVSIAYSSHRLLHSMPNILLALSMSQELLDARHHHSSPPPHLKLSSHST